MKRPAFAVCLLAALLLTLIFVLRPAAEIPVAKPAPAVTAAEAAAPVPSSAPPADTTTAPATSPVATVPTQAETVRQFVEIMGAWENASGLEGDRLEERLRNLITDKNAEAILRAVPPRFHGTYVGNLLLARWAAQDRSSAIQWLAEQSSPTLGEVNAVTKNWVLEDSGGLERYLGALPASAWKSLVLESAGRDALTHDDPEQAFQLLKGMNDSPAKVPLLANAVQQWAEWDPHSAVTEIDKLPDPAARERLILTVASGYATANPDAAADWLRQSFNDGPTLDRGLAGVMQAWVSTGDPATAVQWVTKQPAGPTRDHAFKELIAAWKEANPQTLEYWMSTLSDGSLRAQVAATLGSLASAP